MSETVTLFALGPASRLRLLGTSMAAACALIGCGSSTNAETPGGPDGSVPVDASLADGVAEGATPPGEDAGAGAPDGGDAGGDDGDDSASSDNTANFGAVIDPSEALDAIKAIPPQAFLQPLMAITLPPTAMLTNLPAVATQGATAVPPGQKSKGPLGTPGTCEAQSFGRGLGSYTAARNPDGSMKWDPTLDANLVSAAWLYDWLVSQGKAGPCPMGGIALPYLEHLVLLGGPSEADYPYKPVCSDLADASALTKTFGDEGKFHIGGFASLGPAPNVLGLIKSHINSGYAVAFSEMMLNGYTPQPVLDGGVFYGTGMPHGGHGQLIVGYDDTVGVPGNLGAFVVQNSMSTVWGTEGRVNFAYSTLIGNLGLAAVAWPVNPTAGGQALTASTGDGGAAPAGTPAATLVRAFQWSPAQSTLTYLILVHHFTSPVTVGAISLAEPGTGTTVKATLSAPMSDFYTYIERSDGYDFESGTWTLAVDVGVPGGGAVRYTGTTAITASAPSTRPAAPVLGVSVTGPTGSAATVL